MKSLNCRGLLGLLLFAGMFFSFATASYAQSADNVGGGSFGNFGAGGAYGDFDLSSQAATYNQAAPAATSGASGVYGNAAYQTMGNNYGDSRRTSRQVASRGMGNLNLAPTGLSTLSNHGGGLPRTNLDSFVAQAGGSAELIYGDEGADGLPPYYHFTGEHRIERGIRGNLTTGHRSNLPEAWGWPQ